MVALLIFLWRLLLLPSRSEFLFEAENAALRQQLIILQRKVRGRVRLTNSDRLFFVLLYRWFPSILKTMTVIKPETLVRWHQAGFRRYWRWKSRNLGGRPPISAELRALIQRMSLENTLWGAPHIHGECSSLGSRWRSQRWPSIWRRLLMVALVRAGAHSCTIIYRISPPSTCSWCRPLVFACSTCSSSFG